MPVRKITAGYLNTTSRFQSSKLGRPVNAESSLEMDFLFLLDLDPSVIWFEEQPLKIRYFDAVTGRMKIYTPDVLVRYKDADGSEFQVLYEIKFRVDVQSNWRELKPKFKAAIREGKTKGWKFRVVTEKHIRTPKLANLEFLFHFSRSISPLESDRRADIFNGLRQLRHATPNELMAFLFNDSSTRVEILPVLYRMIYTGAIVADLSQPLTMNSPISLPRVL